LFFITNSERASTALWFAESFNLLPVSLQMREKTTKENIVVDLSDKVASSLVNKHAQPHQQNNEREVNGNIRRGKSFKISSHPAVFH
jgi:hypothetical protein